MEPTQELIALSWSDDCSAIVWSLESGQARTVLKGDTSYIVSACFVPPEQSDSGGSTGGPTRFQVVTSTGDGALLVWDAQTGELLQLLSGHSLAVKSVVSSGMNLVSVGEDKAVRLWNLRSKVVDMPIAHQTGISVRALLSRCFSSFSPVVCIRWKYRSARRQCHEQALHAYLLLLESIVHAPAYVPSNNTIE